MRLAAIHISQSYPFGHDRRLDPWLTFRWQGRPWWYTYASYQFWKHMDHDLWPWPLVVVGWQPHYLRYVIARRDGLLILSAVAWWLWFRVRNSLIRRRPCE
jgi:hypothetical protein